MNLLCACIIPPYVLWWQQPASHMHTHSHMQATPCETPGTVTMPRAAGSAKAPLAQPMCFPVMAVTPLTSPMWVGGGQA